MKTNDVRTVKYSNTLQDELQAVIFRSIIIDCVHLSLSLSSYYRLQTNFQNNRSNNVISKKLKIV